MVGVLVFVFDFFFTFSINFILLLLFLLARFPNTTPQRNTAGALVGLVSSDCSA